MGAVVELMDDQWDLVKDLFDPPVHRGVKGTIPRRDIVDAILHAKLALLGHLWWHDEDAFGFVDDVIGFRGRRLWISSANFTRSSRRSLEFGFWTEEPSLLDGVERFLVKLMGSSEREGVDPASDVFQPDLAPHEFDDEAMADYAAEFEWAGEDE